MNKLYWHIDDTNMGYKNRYIFHITNVETLQESRAINKNRNAYKGKHLIYSFVDSNKYFWYDNNLLYSLKDTLSEYTFHLSHLGALGAFGAKTK